LDVFSRQDISVGVSIDGPPAVQDRYRVDKQGRGSSRAVENGVALLHSQPGIRSGSLSVIDPSLSGSEAYAYLRRLVSVHSVPSLTTGLRCAAASAAGVPSTAAA
jgi:sulfatase maturation enzyme AslB (radical SAM superfamily)